MGSVPHNPPDCNTLPDVESEMTLAEVNRSIQAYYSAFGQKRNAGARQRRIVFELCARKGYRILGYTSKAKFLKEKLGMGVRWGKDSERATEIERSLIKHLSDIPDVPADLNIEDENLPVGVLLLIERIVASWTERVEIFIQARRKHKTQYGPTCWDIRRICDEKGFTIKDTGEEKPPLDLPATTIAKAAWFVGKNADKLKLVLTAQTKTVCLAEIELEKLMADLEKAGVLEKYGLRGNSSNPYSIDGQKSAESADFEPVPMTTDPISAKPVQTEPVWWTPQIYSWPMPLSPGDELYWGNDELVVVSVLQGEDMVLARPVGNPGAQPIRYPKKGFNGWTLRQCFQDRRVAA